MTFKSPFGGIQGCVLREVSYTERGATFVKLKMLDLLPTLPLPFGVKHDNEWGCIHAKSGDASKSSRIRTIHN